MPDSPCPSCTQIILTDNHGRLAHHVSRNGLPCPGGGEMAKREGKPLGKLLDDLVRDAHMLPEERAQIDAAIAAAKKPALRPVRSHTYTFVVMEVSQSTYDEVHANLIAAGYDHAIHKEVRDGTVLDMNGIALGIKS